jgi:hypothetical protein
MRAEKGPQKVRRDDREQEEEGEREEAVSDLELSEEIAEQVAGGAGGRTWTATNPNG